ncbi:MAG: hypothetical protein WC876_07625 [Candidatus Thermoplasmatota archaeon]|jgi:hypothetical protein
MTVNRRNLLEEKRVGAQCHGEKRVQWQRRGTVLWVAPLGAGMEAGSAWTRRETIETTLFNGLGVWLAVR